MRQVELTANASKPESTQFIQCGEYRLAERLSNCNNLPPPKKNTAQLAASMAFAGWPHLFLPSHHHLECAHCCAPLSFIQLLRGVQVLQHIKGLQAGA
jgi:hypothetical protein